MDWADYCIYTDKSVAHVLIVVVLYNSRFFSDSWNSIGCKQLKNDNKKGKCSCFSVLFYKEVDTQKVQKSILCMWTLEKNKFS